MQGRYYGFVGKFVAQQGKRDELLAFLLQASDLLQEDETCLLYVASTSPDEPDAVWTNEMWTTKDGHDRSLERADVKAVISKAMPVVASVDLGVEQSIVGGKGLPKPSASSA